MDPLHSLTNHEGSRFLCLRAACPVPLVYIFVRVNPYRRVCVCRFPLCVPSDSGCSQAASVRTTVFPPFVYPLILVAPKLRVCGQLSFPPMCTTCFMLLPTCECAYN